MFAFEHWLTYLEGIGVMAVNFDDLLKQVKDANLAAAGGAAAPVFDDWTTKKIIDTINTCSKTYGAREAIPAIPPNYNDLLQELKQTPAGMQILAQCTHLPKEVVYHLAEHGDYPTFWWLMRGIGQQYQDDSGFIGSALRNTSDHVRWWGKIAKTPVYQEPTDKIKEEVSPWIEGYLTPLNEGLSYIELIAAKHPRVLTPETAARIVTVAKIPDEIGVVLDLLYADLEKAAEFLQNDAFVKAVQDKFSEANIDAPASNSVAQFEAITKIKAATTSDDIVKSLQNITDPRLFQLACSVAASHPNLGGNGAEFIMQKLAAMKPTEIVNGGDAYIAVQLDNHLVMVDPGDSKNYYQNALKVLARVQAVSPVMNFFQASIYNLEEWKKWFANRALLAQAPLTSDIALLIAQQADFWLPEIMLGALRLGLLSNPECRAAILANSSLLAHVPGGPSNPLRGLVELAGEADPNKIPEYLYIINTSETTILNILAQLPNIEVLVKSEVFCNAVVDNTHAQSPALLLAIVQNEGFKKNQSAPIRAKLMGLVTKVAGLAGSNPEYLPDIVAIIQNPVADQAVIKKLLEDVGINLLASIDVLKAIRDKVSGRNIKLEDPYKGIAEKAVQLALKNITSLSPVTGSIEKLVADYNKIVELEGIAKDLSVTIEGAQQTALEDQKKEIIEKLDPLYAARIKDKMAAIATEDVAKKLAAFQALLKEMTEGTPALAALKGAPACGAAIKELSAAIATLTPKEEEERKEGDEKKKTEERSAGPRETLVSGTMTATFAAIAELELAADSGLEVVERTVDGKKELQVQSNTEPNKAIIYTQRIDANGKECIHFQATTAGYDAALVTDLVARAQNAVVVSADKPQALTLTGGSIAELAAILDGLKDELKSGALCVVLTEGMAARLESENARALQRLKGTVGLLIPSSRVATVPPILFGGGPGGDDDGIAAVASDSAAKQLAKKQLAELQVVATEGQAMLDSWPADAAKQEKIELRGIVNKIKDDYLDNSIPGQPFDLKAFNDLLQKFAEIKAKAAAPKSPTP